MTVDEIWRVITTIGKRAWGAMGATSAFVTLLLTIFYKDYLKDRDIPQWAKDFSPLIVLLVCVFLFSTVMLVSKIVAAWRERAGHVHIPDREEVIYRAHIYKPGSDLLKLSSFAFKAFDGDTMKPEIVQHAVKIGAATGLRLTDAQGINVGFLDVFHFTDDIMEQWKNGDIPEDQLRKEDFLRIPSKGQILSLAVGAIYLSPDVERGVAHQFANMGEIFLRETFPKFQQINLFATIFKPDGARIAKAYKFEISKEAKDRTGPYADDHDLRLRTVKLDQLPNLVGGIGGYHQVVIEMAS